MQGGRHKIPALAVERLVTVSCWGKKGAVLSKRAAAAKAPMLQCKAIRAAQIDLDQKIKEKKGLKVGYKGKRSGFWMSWGWEGKYHQSMDQLLYELIKLLNKK